MTEAARSRLWLRVLALSGRMLEVALPLGCIGLVAFALLWVELLREFYS